MTARFSGVIHVTERGRVLHSSAHGFANRAEKRPNTMTTRFAQASGSKTFTACAVARLVEEGSFAFDSRAADVLDLWPDDFDPRVTIRQLLSHTSGIPDYFDEETQDDDDWFALWDEHPTYTIHGPRDILALFADGTPKSEPGARFAYSNAGFVLLGVLIEQHAGMRFSDFIEQEVFRPAGMESSGYFRFDELPAGTAANYLTAEDPDSMRTNIFAVPFVGQPDGGAFVTAPDMARFWTALQDGDLLPPETVEQLMAPHADVAARGAHYGYGMWIASHKGGQVTPFAEGCDPGVGFLSGLWAERQTSVTVIGNTDAGVWPVYTPLLDAVLAS